MNNKQVIIIFLEYIERYYIFRVLVTYFKVNPKLKF